jgi:hypothetical protein
VPACKSYDEKTEEGCQPVNCKECILVEFLCVDCQRHETCDHKYKPKVLPSNRHAISEYYLSKELRCSPFTKGLEDQFHRKLLQFEIIISEDVKQKKIQHDQEIERIRKERGNAG